MRCEERSFLLHGIAKERSNDEERTEQLKTSREGEGFGVIVERSR